MNAPSKKTSQKTIGTNTATIIVLWPENNARSFLYVQNQSSETVIINVGASPSASNGLKLPPGEEWNPVNPPKGEIRVVGTAVLPNWQSVFTIEESK